MKTFSTLIHALDPMDGEYKTFAGPNIRALSRKLAFEYCQNNRLGYCHIDGEVVAEIPCDDNYKADFSKQINYDDLQIN